MTSKRTSACRLILGAAVTLAGATAAVPAQAQEPRPGGPPADGASETQPADARPRRPFPRDRHRDEVPAASLFERFRGGGRTFAPDPPTDEQWAEASRFIAELSPNRWEVYKGVVDHAQRGERAKWFLYGRYAELQSLQANSPERYEAAKQQVKVEDEIFGLDTKIRAATSPGEADQLRTELRERVAELVEEGLAERERRLTQLQARLDGERRELIADRDRLGDLIERRANLLQETSDRFRAWASGDRRFGRRPPSGEGRPDALRPPSGPAPQPAEPAPAK